MSDTFDRAFAAVIGVEGGYVNDPRDPGGETKYGISKRAYPALDIANLTLDQAKAIYERDYWAKAAGDDLPPPVALVVFDAAVNSGPDHAAKWLQAACGVPQDGLIGPITLKAVAAKSTLDLVTEINAQRLLFLTGLPTWRTFGLGWTRRIVHLGIAATGFEAAPVVTVQTINPAPIVASLDDVRTAFREIQAEKVAA